MDESLWMSGVIGLLLGVVLFLGLLLLLASVSLMLMTDVILCGFPATVELVSIRMVSEFFSSSRRISFFLETNA